eukprot:5344485-Pleurochrysis_carterae.AAC.5
MLLLACVRDDYGRSDDSALKAVSLPICSALRRSNAGIELTDIMDAFKYESPTCLTTNGTLQRSKMTEKAMKCLSTWDRAMREL